MSFEDRYVKVTVTIEDSEMVRTITIPKAREIDVHFAPRLMTTNEQDIDRMIATRPRSAGFEIRGVSDFDYASQQLVIVETEVKERLVEPTPIFDFNQIITRQETTAMDHSTLRERTFRHIRGEQA